MLLFPLIITRRRSHDIELSESSGSEESDASDAVETIQSAMRGYMARQMAMKDLNRSKLLFSIYRTVLFLIKPQFKSI